MNNDKVYWFVRNASAFVLCCLVYPGYCLYVLVSGLRDDLRTVFKCDGSTTIDYPWNWIGWWWNKE